MGELILDRLTKRFPDGTEAVKGVSLRVRDGELFVLVGPSGCGKSTLLAMIAGLEAIDDGELRLDGRVINDLDPKDRNMAMVFQSYAIYPHMTVAQNLSFPLRLAKRPRAEIEQRIHQAASLLELNDVLDRRPASLSGGQRQRVAMGRALVREPSVFLLDEPLSNLDAKLRGRMRIEIARLQKRLGATMVYVTHDQTEALTLGDQIAVLNQGEVQQVGTPRELYSTPRNLFVAGFIGSPAMNFLAGEYRNGRLVLAMIEQELVPAFSARAMEGQTLIVGIRPEHFSEPPSLSNADPVAEPTFEAIAQVVEWHGTDVYVHFLPVKPVASSPKMGPSRDTTVTCGTANLLVARLRRDSRINAGERIRLRLDVSALQLFDASSGLRIGRG